jgi:hypothetical protein
MGPFAGKRFPGLEDGDITKVRKVAILSARPDATKLARETLRAAGLEMRLLERRPIRRGDIRFRMNLVDIVDREER